MKVKFKKLYPDAKAPYKKHLDDAGYDLYVHRIEGHKLVTYYSGIAVEIPKGYCGLLFPRSSVYETGKILTNSVGVIDSNYRGEICGKFISSNSTHDERYDVGERFIQLVIIPYPEVEFVEVARLTITERGEGGFGSTGRN